MERRCSSPLADGLRPTGTNRLTRRRSESVRTKPETGQPQEAGKKQEPGESRVRRYMRQLQQQQQQRQSEDLSSDPWASCEDIALEDHAQWFLDFFRRRDAVRAEQTEQIVARALVAEKPSARLMRRLEAILREPIHLLDPALLESKVQFERSLSHRSWGPGGEDGGWEGQEAPSALSALIPSSALSALSLSSSESSRPSLHSGWSELETAASTPGRRGAGICWELEFAARGAAEEVWSRLCKGCSPQELSIVLADARKHLVSCQVRRLRGLGL